MGMNQLISFRLNLMEFQGAFRFRIHYRKLTYVCAFTRIGTNCVTHH